MIFEDMELLCMLRVLELTSRNLGIVLLGMPSVFEI